MQFGEVPSARRGAILAHSLRLGDDGAEEGPRAVARRCRGDRRRRAFDRSPSPGSIPAISARTRRPTGSPRRPPAPGSRPRRPSPAAPICSPRRAGCWSSTATGSTGSTSSTRPSRSARCRPSRSSSRGRWSRRSRSSRSPRRKRRSSAARRLRCRGRAAAAGRAVRAAPGRR